ncbi:hypothetical protein HMPREF0973_01835 [Prevotella veroralis F0319]|uniref:Uncharacterized protein n=1 Tax=Prevotella veroralis F0319 TaxID=649761 RepID=C9MQD5_9BACT|nr:hypothetical protein HMPREF0973_01835 [Prevotella veroralis F0319]
MRGQGTAEPQLNVLTATPGQIGDLLPAVSAAIDAVGDLTYLLRSKSLGVEKVEQPRTFLALIAYQAQENGIEVAAAGERAGKTQSRDCTNGENGNHCIAHCRLR